MDKNEYIAPSSKEDFNVKEGDIVVSYYSYENDWDGWYAETEEFNEEKIDNYLNLLSTNNMFPVLVGIVTKCEYNKYFNVYYLVLNENGSIVHADNSYLACRINKCWFKCDLAKLDLEKYDLENDLNRVIQEKQKEIRDFEILKCNLFKNETKGEHYA